jgi:hypothetical protein
MKTKALLIIILAIFVSLPAVYAQDQIHKKTKEVINCKVKEIGLDEIKYILPERDDVIQSISKNLVSRLVFENGEEIVFKDSFKDPENYADNRKNAIKVDFLSPLTGNTTFAYERSIKPGRSFEITLGIIGLGIDPEEVDPAGFFTKGGIKFIKSPDFYLRGMRYAHLLKGGYVKPEIAFGYFSRDYYRYDPFSYNRETGRRNIISAALFLNLGKQWIIDNAFLIDFYFGFGYGFSDGTYNDAYHYGYIIGDGSFPIAVQAGLKVGGLFK